MPNAQDDDLVMSLVEQALNQPPETREAWLQTACAGDQELFNQVRDYAQWNHRMGDFLLEPLCSDVRERPPVPAEPAREDPTSTIAYSPDEHVFRPGDLLLNRFRIVREVAQGGMGIVYEARDEKLGRRIALKCARRGFLNRLPPEVRHASEISHPNVCRIFEIHTASTPRGEIDFFTMEYLEGETLRARLRHGPLPEAEVLIVGRQTCAGVAEAHRNHVVHGDLKSNNVILARDAGGGIRAVVTDFGLARGPLGPAEDIAAGVAGASQAGGTPGYMAPELWKGEKPSAASDVYALGVTLYELVANRRPFPPELPWQDRPNHNPAAVRHAWNPILQRCLEADPASRFRDAGEVSAALEPSHSLRWWIGAVAAIVLAAVSVWVTYQRTAHPKEPITLAMLPLEPGPDMKDLADRVSRDAASDLAHLQGGTRVRLTIIPWTDVIGRNANKVEKARAAPLLATHVVRGYISREGDAPENRAAQNGKVLVHVFLTDARTMTDTADWKFEYAAGEVRYAAGAITGVVTLALHLNPPASPVNARASRDYQEGLRLTRRNSTVDSALPLLERAVNADPDSALTWAGLAEAEWFKYFITKDSKWLNRSSESLRQAQNRNPDLAPVHRVNGLLLRRAGAYEKAEAEQQRAIELDPANGDAYRRLGQVYQQEGKGKQALEEFIKATRVQPDDFKTHQDLGAWYAQAGDYDKAAPEYVKCVQLAPDEADPHRILGTAYRNLDRFDEAEHELREAVRLAPTSSAYVSLASALMFMDRNPEAIDDLNKAVDLSPGNSQSWMILGIAYARANQTEKSTQAFELGLEKAEKEPNPRDGEVLSRVAFFAARLHDPGRARYEIKNALELSGVYTSVQEAAVWTYDALGQDEEAVNILEKSPDSVLHDAAWWPDLAGLHENPRFRQLVESRNIHIKK